MAESGNNRFQQRLQQLFAAVQKGDPAALPKTLSLLKKIPDEPNLLHLAGLAHMQTGEYQLAISHLLRSSKIQPRAEVSNSLANAHKSLGAIPEAERHYKDALKLKPQYPEAWKNLGLLFISVQRYEDAEAALRRALELEPTNAGILTSLGDLYKQQEQFDQAINHYQQALAMAPGYVNALHNLGLCYKLTEKLNLAVDCYKQASTVAPGVAEIDFNHANAMFELGEHDQAETLYQSAVRKDPLFTMAHETLSELYWQSGQLEKVESSYRKAIDTAPMNIDLRLSFANVLIAIGRFDTAKALIEDTLKIETTTEMLHVQGKLYANELDYSNARQCFEHALENAFASDIAQDLVRLHILLGNYAEAQELLDSLQARKPNDQLNWALKGLCWRLLDDPRYRWLIDYQTHIRQYTLPTPAGYLSLTDFLNDLEEVLLGMHNTRLEPSKQTLKHGTQTPGRLLHKPHPVIQSYKASLTEVVGDYIGSMAEDSSHPLSRRKVKGKNRFLFSGSWSVKLQSSGFHINHVHPEGWISSACYIALPRRLSSGNNHDGCIKFGESALGLGDREVTERIVRPERGQLVLFPSFTWHGTYDFECRSDEYRMTAPFDVVPR